MMNLLKKTSHEKRIPYQKKKQPYLFCPELQKVQEAKKLKSFYSVMEQPAFTNWLNFGSLHLGPWSFPWLQQCLVADQQEYTTPG